MGLVHYIKFEHSFYRRTKKQDQSPLAACTAGQAGIWTLANLFWQAENCLQIFRQPPSFFLERAFGAALPA